MPKPKHHGSMHLCNWPHCRRPVPLDMWGCRGHWFTLPEDLRTAIVSAWRFGRGRSSPEWQKAHQAALAWIADIHNQVKSMNVTSPPVPTKELPPC